MSLCLFFFLCLLLPTVVWSHGYTTDPKTRAYWCMLRRTCGAVQYDGQSIVGLDGFPESGPPDGKLASATHWHDRFTPLDKQTASFWPKNEINSNPVNFTWYFLTPHATGAFRYYMTLPNWDPNMPLARSQFDLTPFCTINYGRALPAVDTNHVCALPTRKGYHVIYIVWDVADTPYSHYLTVDVGLDITALAFNGTFNAYFKATSNISINDLTQLTIARPNKYYGDAAIHYGIDTLYIGPISAGSVWNGKECLKIDWAKPLTQELHNGGVKVAASFGGPNTVDVTSGATADQVSEVYKKVIETLNSSQIDIDVEGDGFNPDIAFSALSTVIAQYPNLVISLSLPVLPSGLKEKELNYIRKAKANGLDFKVVIKAMNYPEEYSDMGQRAVMAAEATKAQLATIYEGLSDMQIYPKILVSPMIGRNDRPGESTFSFSDADILSVYARNKGVSIVMRDLTRDAQGNGKTSSGFDMQTIPFEFTKRFAFDLEIPSRK